MTAIKSETKRDATTGGGEEGETEKRDAKREMLTWTERFEMDRTKEDGKERIEVIRG